MPEEQANSIPRNDLVDSDTKQWIAELVAAVVSNYDKAVNQRFNALEQLLEQFERQFAMLTAGYAEMAAMVQALMGHLITDDEESRTSFMKYLKESREAMMESMKYAGDLAEREDNRFTARAQNTAESNQSSEKSE